MRLSIISGLLLAVLALGQPVFAQDGEPSSVSIDSGRWEPLGQIPVDQAGAGRRGYALAGEGAEVAEPRTSRIAVHTVASNNFFREQTGDFLITQRYETHTLALDIRRGFKTPILPRVELGAQVQVSERDSGFLNGFISGFESLCFSMSGVQSAKNQLRDLGTPLPFGAFVTKDGHAIYSGSGRRRRHRRFLIRRQGAPPRRGAGVERHACRRASWPERVGHFAVCRGQLRRRRRQPRQAALNWVAFHGDVRATVALDRVSDWNLPLKRRTLGFSAGPELRLSRDSSVSVQIDGNTTPYLPTGTTAFDKDYGSITIGLGHRFRTGRDGDRLADLRARKHEPAISRPLEHRSRRIVRHQV